MKRFHSDAFYANLESMADGVIELDIQERGERLQNAIRIRSMKGVQHSTEWRTLKITRSRSLTLTPKRR
jgi:KaiC/GvpD/RAD55 family RecA-like ATPase